MSNYHNDPYKPAPKRRDEWFGGAIKEIPEMEWLVDGFIPVGSVTWLYGRPGSFKSFIGLDLAMRVAAGGEWCGRGVKQGAVAYWAAEDPRGTLNRRRAWQQLNGDGGPLLVWNSSLCVSDENAEGKAVAVSQVAAMNRRLEDAQLDVPLRLLVIDTFAKTSKSDTREEVYQYMKHIRSALHQNPDLSIVIIDHTNKGGESYIGSQSKLGDCDAMASIVRRGDKAVLTTGGDAGKVRNGEEFEATFEMVPVASHRTLVARHVVGEAAVKAVEEQTSKMSAADVIREIMDQAQDALSDAELRLRFFEHPAHKGMADDTIRKRLYRYKVDRDGKPKPADRPSVIEVLKEAQKHVGEGAPIQDLRRAFFAHPGHEGLNDNALRSRWCRAFKYVPQGDA